MKTRCLLSLGLLFFLCTCSKEASVSFTKMEHLYISSPNAEKMYDVLTLDFGLPTVWAYQSWGDFSSGGVSMGNVVIELVEDDALQANTQYGIALEPSTSLSSVVRVLDTINIAHGEVSKGAAWSVISLNQLLPERINLFVCDYHDRPSIAQGRTEATAQLYSANGGPLGIELVSAIRIGTDNSKERSKQLATLPGVTHNDTQLQFSQGPQLMLMESAQPYLGLSIKVHSLEATKKALEAIGWYYRMTEHGLMLVDSPLETTLYFEE